MGKTATESGINDLYLGVKLALTEQRGVFPATSILPQVTLPTGGEAFSAGRSLPGVNFLYGWDLTETVSLAGSTQVNAAVGDRNQDYREWAQSLSGAVALGDRAGLYGEWYALVPSGLDAARGVPQRTDRALPEQRTHLARKRGSSVGHPRRIRFERRGRGRVRGRRRGVPDAVTRSLRTGGKVFRRPWCTDRKSRLVRCCEVDEVAA